MESTKYKKTNSPLAFLRMLRHITPGVRVASKAKNNLENFFYVLFKDLFAKYPMVNELRTVRNDRDNILLSSIAKLLDKAPTKTLVLVQRILSGS
jgi:hypothetical protein